MFKSPGTKNGKELGLDEQINLFSFFLTLATVLRKKKTFTRHPEFN